MRSLVLVVAGLSGIFLGLTLEGCQDSCTIGAEGCECTAGGACDPGLTCLSNTCVNAGPNPDEVGDGDSVGSNDEVGTSSTTSDSSGEATTMEGEATTMEGEGGEGVKLDTLQEEQSGDGLPCTESGCKKVDLLFALDGSASMIEEINALKQGAAFLGIVAALEGLNCGDIDYRIGVTGDSDNGWVVPNSWANPNPWFDSEELSAAEISVHFQAAATLVAGAEAELGCEHVLSTAVDLLESDQSGFLREDALLVLVLMSDVDDYGLYDQVGGNSCGLGCSASGQPVAELQDTLVALKGGDAAGVSAIVIAADPAVDGGVSFCTQPLSCGPPVEGFHADRLYEFAGLQTGTNGYTSDICEGASGVPLVVEIALTEDIDLACQDFEPVG